MVNVLWLFLAVPWVGLQCVIVIFPYHTQLRFVVLTYFLELLRAEIVDCGIK